MVKNPPTYAGDTSSIPGQEKEMATHSSILAMGRGARRATVRGVTESDMTERLNTPHTHGVLNTGDFDSISYNSQNNQRGTFP